MRAPESSRNEMLTGTGPGARPSQLRPTLAPERSPDCTSTR